MARTKVTTVHDAFIRRKYERSGLRVEDIPYSPAMQVLRERLLAEFPTDFRGTDDYDVEGYLFRVLARLKRQRALATKFRDRKGPKALRDAIR